jgi:hypothetical protein
LVIVALYVPLYFWRKMTDKRDGLDPLGTLPVVVGAPGGVDYDTDEPHIEEPVMTSEGMTHEGLDSVPTMSSMQAETDR